MFCVKCGKQISDGDMFCPGCGTAVKQTESKPASEGKIERKPMREVRVYAEKPSVGLMGGGGKSDYYVYIDNAEYKCSYKSKEPLVIKVTPEIHIIEASLNKRSSTEKMAKITDVAGEAGLSGAFGATGVILGISSAITSKIVPAMNKKQEGAVMFDATDEAVTTFRLSTSRLGGKVIITEEY